MYSFAHKPVLDHLEGPQYSDYLGFSPPAVIARHLEYSTDDGVTRCGSRSSRSTEVGSHNVEKTQLYDAN